jgi:uncharacterized protein YqjF (DUF2071 family)
VSRADTWTSRQTWEHVLFAHWRLPASAVRPLVPGELDIEAFDGSTWVGVVPFLITGLTRRGLPSVPWLSSFPEMNLRLYVRRRHGATVGDAERDPASSSAGVWFVSLDAGNPLAVWAARRFFHLPYFRADMQVSVRGGRVRYSSTRRSRGLPRVEFRGSYAPTGPVVEPKPGTLEHFLAERYRLYTIARDGRLLTVEIDHRPWALQPAEAAIEVNEVARPQGVPVDGPPVHLMYSRRQDTRVWPMREASAQ